MIAIPVKCALNLFDIRLFGKVNELGLLLWEQAIVFSRVCRDKNKHLSSVLRDNLVEWLDISLSFAPCGPKMTLARLVKSPNQNQKRRV